MAGGFRDRCMVGATLAGVRVLTQVPDGVQGQPTWNVVFVCGHKGRISKMALRAAANANTLLRCVDCRTPGAERAAAEPIKLWVDRVLDVFGQERERFVVTCVACRTPFAMVGSWKTHLHKCLGEDSIGLTRDECRSRRKRLVRGRTISVKRMTKRELAVGRLLYPDEHIARPKTRVDCDQVPRPCPFVACRYHLYLDVHPGTGSIKLNFPDLEPDELRESCTLDVADAGGETLEHVGELANLTRERVRQIEQKALVRLRVFPLADHDDEPRRPCRAHHT